MNKIPLLEVKLANKQLASYLVETPLVRAYPLEELFGVSHPIYLKCEHLQVTGSFKARGALLALLALSSKKGIVTRSSGNFGKAVAYAAHLFSIPATIVLPKNLPLVKKEAIEKYGPEVIFCASRQEEEERVKVEALIRGHDLLSPYDHEAVILGHATLGCELLEQCPSISHYLCPIGGGSLMGGSAMILKEYGSSVETIGLEPSGADDYLRSREEGHRVRLDPVSTIADGLRAPTVGGLTYPLLNKYVDRVLSIPDVLIQEAMHLLYYKMGMIVEPSAAISIAPFLKGFRPSGATVSVLTGGNVDLPDFFKWIGADTQASVAQ